jgi:hypothetical protein
MRSMTKDPARELEKAMRFDRANFFDFALTDKRSAHQQREAIKRRDKRETVREIARTYNVGHSTISRLQA